MQCGASRQVITPTRPTCMAGYGDRLQPSQGKYADLYVKAVALADADRRIAIVSFDLIGLDDWLVRRIQQRVGQTTGLGARDLLLSCSHTHCGPTVRQCDRQWYGSLDDAYLEDVVAAAGEAVDGAIANLGPCRLTAGVRKVRFGVNRRRPTPDGVVMRPNPDGVTDPELRVLRLVDEQDQDRALLFSTGCHPTTMGGLLLGPDYPGFAEKEIEKERPGAVSAFLQGCGGDVKPWNMTADHQFLPGTVEIVDKTGRWLGREALAVLDGTMQQVTGPIRTAGSRIELPLETPPDIEQIHAAATSADRAHQFWAVRLREILDRGEPLPDHVSMPMQAMVLGDELALVAMGGEVCCGIGLAIKRALQPMTVIPLGYVNDATGYIPSADMVPQGGYEVDGSRYYLGLPSRVRADAEQCIVREAERLIRDAT